MNSNQPPRILFSSRRPPLRRAAARRGRPGGLRHFATGEWTRAGYRAPACYVANASPLVKATFSVAPTNLPVVRLFAETSAAVGGFAVTDVSFSNGAASNVVLSTRSATTNCVLKETFDLTWKAVVSNETEIVTNVLGKTDGHVFYTILGEPVEPWNDDTITNQNVWASALDFLVETNVCGKATFKTNALARLTNYLFSDFDLHYDVEWGGSRYVKDIPGRMLEEFFFLSGYMGKTEGNIVNCYDQAGALAFLGKAIGIEAEILHMAPFGYILETELIGRGRCNNPFYANPLYGFDTRHVCPTNSPNRSAFGNHRFVRLGTQIFDACAGPVRGEWSFDEYKRNVIDTITTNTLYSTGTNATPYLTIKEVR